VAHVAAIPGEADQAPLARGLEGRWRARLGDLAGAGLAFARLRELAAGFAPGSEDPRAGTVAALLAEAAELERRRTRDPLAAQRHLAAALRLRPRDPELLRAYREVGALVAQNAAGDDDGALESLLASEPPAVGVGAPGEESLLPRAQSGFPATEAASATHTTLTDRPPGGLPRFDLSLPAEGDDAAPGEDSMDAAGEARIEELTRKMHADPANDAVADELATLLERAGRGHELLALLSGRMEDAGPERRAELAPRARAAMERLAVEAEKAGRNDEAALFRSAMEMLKG
jgi:hypothetical protein